MSSLQAYHNNDTKQAIGDVAKDNKRLSARGSLAEYANPELQRDEELAWEKIIQERGSNV